MNVRTIRITLGSITSGGATCANPIIEWIYGEDLVVNCIHTDGSLEIQIPADTDLKDVCLEGYILCQECSTCPPQAFKVCLCDDNADCGDCETCKNGFCVSYCDTGVCNPNTQTCGECLTKDDCPFNLICDKGKCVCPPGYPYKNQKGECVKCRVDLECGNCETCDNGKCVPKCPDNKCIGDKCVECTISGHCGPNEICSDEYKCICPPPFVRDSNGDCVAPPPCTSDDDCPECYICGPGGCIPKVCPDGYVCYKDECVKECDCTSPICPKGAACNRINSTTCICQECTGTCAAGCSEGCYCKNGVTCEPNPCNRPCDSTSECAEGCTCENGICTPCDSFGCNECNLKKGCKCVSGKCQQDPCKGDCVFGQCGTGCGCDEGDCVSCDKLSCGECAKVKGCKCINNKCQQDPDGTPCSDTLSIEKVDSTCDLKGILNTADTCACPKITMVARIDSVVENVNDYAVTFRVELRQGTAANAAFVDTLPLIGDTGIINDLASAGIIQITQEVLIRDTATGQTTIANVDETSVGVANIDFSDPAAALFTYNISKTPLANVNPNLVTDGYIFSFSQTTPLQFPNNCVYNPITLIGSMEFDYTTSVPLFKLEQIAAGNTAVQSSFTRSTVKASTSGRYPLFTWYRSSDATFGNTEVFRRAYVQPSGNVNEYVDVLSDPSEEDGLWSGYRYKLDTDCSCSATAVYASECENPGRVVFCQPEDISFVMDNCNRLLTISQDVFVCDVNQDIAQYNTVDYTVNADAQVEYQLYFNGTLAGTYVADSDGLLFSNGQSFAWADPITEVKLVQNHDDCDECAIVKTNPPANDCCVGFPLTLTASANVAESQIEANVSNGAVGQTGCTVEIYRLEGADVIYITNRVTDADGDVVFQNLADGYTYRVVVTGACDPDSCLAPIDVFYDTCVGLRGDFNLVAQCVIVNNIPQLNLQVTAASPNPVGNYTFTVGGQSYTLPETGGTITNINVTPGDTFTVNIVSPSTCTENVSVTSTACGTILIENVEYDCVEDEIVISVNSYTPPLTVEVTDESGNSESIVVPVLDNTITMPAGSLVSGDTLTVVVTDDDGDAGGVTASTSVCCDDVVLAWEDNYALSTESNGTYLTLTDIDGGTPPYEITLNRPSGGPLVFTISNLGTQLPHNLINQLPGEGTYTGTVSYDDANCSSPFSVTINEALVVGVTYDCVDEEFDINIQGGEPTYNVNDIVNGVPIYNDNVAASGVVSVPAAGLTEGDAYTVIVTDVNGVTRNTSGTISCCTLEIVSSGQLCSAGNYFVSITAQFPSTANTGTFEVFSDAGRTVLVGSQGPIAASPNPRTFLVNATANGTYYWRLTDNTTGCTQEGVSVINCNDCDISSAGWNVTPMVNINCGAAVGTADFTINNLIATGAQITSIDWESLDGCGTGNVTNSGTVAGSGTNTQNFTITLFDVLGVTADCSSACCVRFTVNYDFNGTPCTASLTSGGVEYGAGTAYPGSVSCPWCA